MKPKLDDRTKYFSINLFYYFLIVAGAIIGLGVGYGGDEPNSSPDFKGAFAVVGMFAIIILGFKIAMDMTNRAFPKKE